MGCRHHLLLEVRKVKPRRYRAPSDGPALQLARSTSALASSAAELRVRVWIDDALELLEVMPDTCALDVAARGGLPISGVARQLGVSRQATTLHLVAALLKLRGTPAARALLEALLEG